MKNILLIAAMPEELDALKDKLSKFKEKSYGVIKGIEFKTKKGNVFAFVGKVGKANTAFNIGYLAAQMDIKRIINFGVAGSLSKNIVPLDVVVAEKVCYFDCDLTSDPKYKLGQMAGEELYYLADPTINRILNKINTTLNIKTGTIISSDSFATKANMTEDLLKHFDNPLCVDMESGAVGQISHRLNIPFTIIRAISDMVLAESNTDMFNEFLEMSSRRAASTVLHILNNEYVDEQ